jgi:AAA+ ATPase superfamily predicted ATPase
MFIGRTKELMQISEKLRNQHQAQLMILYGRHRVGKSRLIRESLKSESKVLYFEGIEGERQAVQIDHFLSELSRQTGRVKLAAKNWHEAFLGLVAVVYKPTCI